VIQEVQDKSDSLSNSVSSFSLVDYLSAALLRAILLESSRYSEASRNAKTVEANLKDKPTTAESTNEKLETELRKRVHFILHLLNHFLY